MTQRPNWTDSKEKIDRINYFLRLTVLALIPAILIQLETVFLILCLPAIFFQVVLVRQRLNSIGIINGHIWWFFGLCVPLVNLVLALILLFKAPKRPVLIHITEMPEL